MFAFFGGLSADAAEPGELTLRADIGALFDESEDYVYSQSVVTFDPDAIDPDEGVRGALGLRYQQSEIIDFGVALSLSRFRADSISLDPAGLSFFAINPAVGAVVPIAASDGRAEQRRLNVQLDLEGGYSLDVAGLDARVFGGVRMRYFLDDISSSSTLAATVTEIDRESWFFGAGPRLGLEARKMLSDNVSIGGMAAGTVLLGRRETTIDQSSVIFLSGRVLRDDEILVAPGGEVEASLNLHVGEGVSLLSVGYRADILANVIDSDPGQPIAAGAVFDPIAFGDDAAALITHGPFLRVDFPF